MLEERDCSACVYLKNCLTLALKFRRILLIRKERSGCVNLTWKFLLGAGS